jgi:hypothetical protein
MGCGQRATAVKPSNFRTLERFGGGGATNRGSARLLHLDRHLCPRARCASSQPLRMLHLLAKDRCSLASLVGCRWPGGGGSPRHGGAGQGGRPGDSGSLRHGGGQRELEAEVDSGSLRRQPAQEQSTGWQARRGKEAPAATRSWVRIRREGREEKIRRK